MSRTHVVVGAGVIGSTLAELLANDGQEVIVVTRSGSGPTHKNIKRVAADVSDLSKLLEIAPSAAAIYNCVNPPYHRWAKEWPPIAASKNTCHVCKAWNKPKPQGPKINEVTTDWEI